MAGKLLLVLLMVSYSSGLELSQVLVLSRHNLRTPLTETLARMTPKSWPVWNNPAGHLTAKGALLEKYMGEYFAAYLHQQGLVSENCPDDKSVHIYANTKQRTKETARYFAEAAFPYCNIKVNYKNITEMDPIFNPVVHNMTEAFKNAVKLEMQDRLDKSDLREVYTELNRITDIKNSAICKEDNYCDLAEDKDDVIFEIEKEPNVTGPLFIGNSMVDSFLMSYYEGMPLNEIAWGEIKNEQQWRLLTKLVKENQNVRFNLTTAAKEIARPLLRYAKEKIESDIKFIILVGHDSNLSPILTSLEFEPFVLPEQFELTPIGGKLVFQKWTEGPTELLKIEFFYQSSKQIRNGVKLSLDNPPKKMLMRLKKCATDENGYCPWNKFVRILNEVVDY